MASQGSSSPEASGSAALASPPLDAMDVDFGSAAPPHPSGRPDDNGPPQLSSQMPPYAHASAGAPPPVPLVPGTRYTWLPWYIYSFLTKQWEKVPTFDVAAEFGVAQPAHPTPRKEGSDITMVTWNVDADAYEHEARLKALLLALHDADQQGTPDIVFLQELSGIGKHTLAADHWVRANYYVAGIDWMLNDRNQPFYNATLMHRGRFVRGRCAKYPCLGGCQVVWYPSRYGRYALCCDILSPQPSSGAKTVRLINLHFDDLAWATSLRPRQFEVIAQVAHTDGIGAGLVAGDFNPDTSSATRDDNNAVSESNLQDCWTTLRGDASEFPGITWGLNGKSAGLMETRPPGRLEKVLMWGMTPKTIEIIDPGKVPMEVPATIVDRQGNPVPHDPANEPRQIPWSEHSGLVVTFALPPPSDDLLPTAAIRPAPPEATPAGAGNPVDALVTLSATVSAARSTLSKALLASNSLEMMINDRRMAAAPRPAMRPADPSTGSELEAALGNISSGDNGGVGDAGGTKDAGDAGEGGQTGQTGESGGFGSGVGEQAGQAGQVGQSGETGGARQDEDMNDSFVVL